MNGNSVRRRQRGGGNIKAVIFIALLAFLVYASIKVIPPFVNNYELQDTMETTARYGAFSQQTDKEIKDIIWKKIRELEIPAQYEALKVVKGNRQVSISLAYTVDVSLLGYNLRLSFNPQVDNRAAF